VSISRTFSLAEIASVLTTSGAGHDTGKIVILP
jgi:hypothetical protein